MQRSIDLTAVLAVEPKQMRCMVRLRTTMWDDKNGVHIKKSLTFLRRQCEGFNVIEEDVDASGVELVFKRITNLNECADGVYEVMMCNVSHDYESGHVDDYDYMLVVGK